ncbi:MAG: hypothetical protein K0R84_1127, partial [Clostridia bacterium]|nr:hypothetical protein [Clostridia bacterium]
FTMDDMVRHIGIFTTYLANHQDEYNVDLDSVFISGGSAGGHLTLAAGLGLHSGKYSDILDPRLKVKGLIPFYPANGLSRNLKIDGSGALINATALVEKDSPPCLIYQGSHDGLVPPLVALSFKDEYIDKGNERCAVLNMLFGSHSSDLYFAGYYNQVFLYYMERFMYKYRG